LSMCCKFSPPHELHLYTQCTKSTKIMAREDDVAAPLRCQVVLLAPTSKLNI